MPYIELNTSLDLTKDIKDKIVDEFNNLITTLPGKSKYWLMVKINDKQDLYFRENSNGNVFIKVLVYGSPISENILNEFTSKVSNYISNLLNVDKERIYIYYNFTPYWGYNGGNF